MIQIFWEITDAIKKKTEYLIHASKDVGLDAD
jgi:hypothetical protein